MSNVLVFNFPGEGHINPTIALVEELMQRGEDVVYYCVEDYKEKIEQTGAEFRAYENFMPKPGTLNEDPQKLDREKLMTHLIKGMDDVMEQELDTLKTEAYDYVIYDNNFAAGKMIADVLQLPKISSCTTFALNSEVVSEFMKNEENQIMNIEIPQTGEVHAITEKWENEYGLPIRRFQDIMNQPGDMTIVYTSELYQPYAEEFDESFKFVGPSIAPRRDVEPFSFENLPEGKLIYISMGTVFNDQPELYETCFDAFRNSEANVVMSVGKKINVEDFEDIPDNFFVHNYVPQLEVLEQADVFFTHGGMNSSSEGLYYGVPLVVLPVRGDQPIIAKRIEELEAGFKLDREKVTADQLKTSANRILNEPRYKENSEKVGESLQEAGGYMRAADEIISFKLDYSIE
ncbi:glycosyl transferase [Halobacillus salinarum]|uniref:Glycosyl transferase n=1 Tax=Halobacillus salinarum TaxID=2932257 RepID=A0ABY4EKK0_9BACI|nr:macrolide family glycosyltransferase [Halobacillus salinarum]UOQ44955.1 glycosyl transferase [Halobacillus salinarum]